MYPLSAFAPAPSSLQKVELSETKAWQSPADHVFMVCEILKEGPNQKGLSVSGFLWILALAAAMDHILMKVSRGSISTI
ncbi:hypothetical protein V6N13_094318 [Hibiscus sabdariffa]|uniref:Uncharacterized protein n=1 Tax=Hibiscus sabdariffa TaxID=183260 RepID=A0ABR2ABP3_9ROSI